MENIDITTISKDPTASKEVREVYAALKRYKESNGRTTWLKQRDKAWAAIGENKFFDDNDKLEAEAEKQGQKLLPIDKVSKGVQGSCAIVTDSKPEVKFLPVGSGDLYVAELLKRAHDVVWRKNDGETIAYDVVEDAKVACIGAFHAFLNPGKGLFGRVEFESIDPSDLYFDAESRKHDFSDTHLIYARLRSKSYIDEKYPEIDEKDLVFAQDLQKSGDEDADESAGLTTGDNYAEGEKDSIADSGQEARDIWEIQAWMLKVVAEDWIITGPKEADIRQLKPEEIEDGETPEKAAERIGGKHIKRRVEKRELRFIVGKKMLRRKINPLGVDADGDPVVPLILLRHDRGKTAYGRCPVQKALPINQEKIKRRAQYIFANSQLFNSPIVRMEGSKWTGPPGVAGSELVVSKTGTAMPPYRLQPGNAGTINFADMEQRADTDIDDCFDMSDVMRGKLPAGEQKPSGRAVLALQDMGGMMSKPFLRKVENAYVRLAKVNIHLIINNWTRDQWERLIEDDEKQTWTPDGKLEPGEGDQDQQQFQAQQAEVENKWMAALEKLRPADPRQEPDLSVMELDIVMTAGSSMPTNRMAKYSLAVELVGAGIYDAEAALEYVDDPGKDKVIARMKEKEQAAMQQAMMKQGVK